MMIFLLSDDFFWPLMIFLFFFALWWCFFALSWFLATLNILSIKTMAMIKGRNKNGCSFCETFQVAPILFCETFHQVPPILNCNSIMVMVLFMTSLMIKLTFLWNESLSICLILKQFFKGTVYFTKSLDIPTQAKFAIIECKLRLLSTFNALELWVLWGDFLHTK